MPWHRLCSQCAAVSGTTAATFGRHAVSRAVTQLVIHLLVTADCGCVSRQIELDLTWISRVVGCGRCCAIAVMHQAC